MNIKKRNVSIQAPGQHTELDTCTCIPIPLVPTQTKKDIGEDEQHCFLSPCLTHQLQARLHAWLPDALPTSIFLLHISQWEQLYVSLQSRSVQQRQRFHAPATVLEQITINGRRAIRTDDQVLTHAGVGIALAFPYVDHQGAYNILERIYTHVDLLQAETMLPPLTHETEIAMSIATITNDLFSEQPLASLLSYTEMVTRRLILRPAIPAYIGKSPMIEEKSLLVPASSLLAHSTSSNSPYHSQIPFMQLPTTLPHQFTYLIPYPIASQLRCAPVGRDQYRLTVAMADPLDTVAIHQLEQLTSMTIFPVACDIALLDALLTQMW